MLSLAKALALQQEPDVGGGTLPPTLMFRFYQTARRIAERHTPAMVRTWVQAIMRFRAGIDEDALRAAIAGQDLAGIQAVVERSQCAVVGMRARIIANVSCFERMLRDLDGPLARTARTTGAASADTMRQAGLAMEFNGFHPNVIMFARERSATLVKDVSDDVREAVRIAITRGAQGGLTVAEQAAEIRSIVGLPPNWTEAPSKFAQELRDGRASAADRRLLTRTDRRTIRARIKRGTVTEKFVKRMRKRYEEKLVKRRALNIARTETLRAANFGQHESWVQGMQQGVISKNSRRFWIVTPDERLSIEHSWIPAMNPKGRRMDEMFDTPDGLVMYPPSRTNCRCGVGLGIAP